MCIIYMLYICVYVSVCTRRSMYMYTYMYIYLYMFVYRSVHIYMHKYTNKFVFAYVHIYVCKHTHTYICITICTHIYISIYILAQWRVTEGDRHIAVAWRRFHTACNGFQRLCRDKGTDLFARLRKWRRLLFLDAGRT